MNQPAAVKDTIFTLLHGQPLAVLSTVGEDAPYASLVAYAVSADGRHLYFVTPRATRKFANLAANPRAALLITDSRNHLQDFLLAAAVTAVGRAVAVAPDAREAILDQYVGRHPHLAVFARSPGSVLVDIRVERYILVERFQDVTEYRVDHDVDHVPS